MYNVWGNTRRIQASPTEAATWRPRLLSIWCWPVALWLLALALSIVGCAAIQPPPGGPADSTGALLTLSEPADRSVNVPTSPTLHFEFDRLVDRASFITAFSITPYLTGVPSFDWSGRDEVTVTLPAALRDSTTYTVTLGRTLRSMHGVTSRMPIVRTFSTGPAIDTGMLEGVVLPAFTGHQPTMAEIYIQAYDITDGRADTLDVRKTLPDLITQPADNGAWTFVALKVHHRYRVYATTDSYRDHLYNIGVDAIGMPTSDVLLDSASVRGCYLRMTPIVDTTRPQLLSATAIDSNHVLVRFSETLDSTTVRRSDFRINGEPIAALFRPHGGARAGIWELVTSRIFAAGSQRRLQIDADSIRDLAGNALEPIADTFRYEMPDEVHSAGRLSLEHVGITDSLESVDRFARIAIRFSDAVNPRIDSGIRLDDVHGRAIPLRYHWVDDAWLEVQPMDSLANAAWYVLNISTRGLTRAVGDDSMLVLDTNYTYHFRTLDETTTGSLSGTISVASGGTTQYPRSRLVVQLVRNGAVYRELRLGHGDSTYQFVKIPANQYRVRAFLSRDGSCVYDGGSGSPWRFADWTGDYGKVIQSRERWDVAGIDFVVR